MTLCECGNETSRVLPSKDENGRQVCDDCYFEIYGSQEVFE